MEKSDLTELKEILMKRVKENELRKVDQQMTCNLIACYLSIVYYELECEKVMYEFNKKKGS